MQTFGQIIQEKLNFFDITQKKLADLAGVNVTYINKILKDKTSNPSFGVVRRIAKALNISDAELDYVFQMNDGNRIIKADEEDIKQTLTAEEKQSLNGITAALIKTDMNDIKNLANIINKISDFQQLRQTYYVVTRIDKEQTLILTLNKIDEDFLNLYSSFLKINDFLIVKDIVNMPYTASIITIKDLLDILKSIDDFDAIILKEYIDENMQPKY